MMAKETEEQIEARMEAARNKLSQDVQDKFNKDGDVDERDRRLESAGRLRRTEPVAKTAPAKKAPVVTKEQLAKSGFDNLRDYMNAQKGLTRRGGAASTPAAKKEETSVDSAVMAGEARRRQKSAVMNDEKRKRSAAANVAGAALANRYNSISEDMYNPGSAAAAFAERGMKKGGSINGIAKRGLTKCKMR
jgi:hypothetical protein